MRTLWKYRNDAGGDAAFGASFWGWANLAVIWEPRDLWVGVYWKRLNVSGGRGLALYVCLIPTLVLRLRLYAYHGDTQRRRWEHGWGLLGRRS